LKVLMVCGSYPPEVCGVGDYTAKLIESLQRLGAEVTALHGMRWDWHATKMVRAAIARHSSDVIHIQYPSVGYGRSLMPQLLSIRVPAIVTLHEFSHVKALRRAASVPFLLAGERLVFTSQYELDYVRRRFPWIARKSVVIPIGANIVPVRRGQERQTDEVIYFGLIAPRKGLEQVLELASNLKRDGSTLKVRLIGKVPEAFQAYAERLKEDAKHLPVVWTKDASELEVAERLAGASVAYLPFPDGASERRGSLKAVLSAGVPCVSTRGKQTSRQLQDVLSLASDSMDAVKSVKALLDDHSAWERASAKGVAYAESFRWESIARSHLDIYEECYREGKRHR
jgi:glycosyltransferase involved in cell wall biosynthesis